MSSLNTTAPVWVEQMDLCRWYAISGDGPDLGLPATPPGTRFLADTDPARDARLNPARTVKERLRRASGRPPKSPWHGTMGFSAITEAWNGAAYASRYGSSGSMIVFGGGHNDYFGSGVHAFDLALREWRRIADGYVSGRHADYGEGAVYPDARYPDGSPLPPHTYDYVQYDPVSSDYILLKGQTELGPKVKAVTIPQLFNLDTLSWRQGPRHPTARLNSGGWTTWDASRRVIWGHSGDDGGGNAFIGYSPDGRNADGTCGRWTRQYPNKLPGIANHNAMQFEPMRDRIIVAVHARDGLYEIDPADPAKEMVRLQCAGSKPVLHQYAALEYAAALQRLVYFSPMDNGKVYTIAPGSMNASHPEITDAWEWQAYGSDPGTLDPIADAASRSRYPVNRSQCFGRFRIASFEAVDVAILVRHVDSPVYAMRLN